MASSSSESPLYHILKTFPEERFRVLASYFQSLSLEEARSLLKDPDDIVIFSPPHRLLWKLFLKTPDGRRLFSTLPDFSWNREHPGVLTLTSDGYLSLGGQVVSDSLFQLSLFRHFLSMTQLVKLIDELPEQTKQQVTALYLNNCSIMADDCTKHLFPLILSNSLPKLCHVNLEFTRIESNPDFNTQLERVLDVIDMVVLTGTGFASSDNEQWFGSSQSFTSQRADHLIWIRPSHLHVKAWYRFFANRHDQKEIEQVVFDRHTNYYSTSANLFHE